MCPITVEIISYKDFRLFITDCRVILIYNMYLEKLYVIVCQWLATGRRLSLGTPVSSTNKTDRHDIAKILLKVALNTITPFPIFYLLVPFVTTNVIMYRTCIEWNFTSTNYWKTFTKIDYRYKDPVYKYNSNFQEI